MQLCVCETENDEDHMLCQCQPLLPASCFFCYILCPDNAVTDEVKNVLLNHTKNGFSIKIINNQASICCIFINSH